jgi:threonyl-tRNA synthetase
LIKREEPIDDDVASTSAELHQLIKREKPIHDAVASTSEEQHQLIKRNTLVHDAVATTSPEQHQLIKKEDFIDIKDEPLINEGDDCSIKLVSYHLFLTLISALQDLIKA